MIAIRSRRFWEGALSVTAYELSTSRVDALLSLLDHADSSTAHADAERELGELCYPRAPTRQLGIIYGDEISSFVERSDQLTWESGVVPPLRHALLHGGPSAKAFAAQRLGILRDVHSFASILTLLSDPIALVRRAAARALQYFCDERAVGPLICAIDDVDEETATGASGSLGMLGFRTAVPALLAATAARPWRRRQAAYYGLSGIDDARCVVGARLGLADPKPQVRKAAKAVLARAERLRRGTW